MTDDVRLEFKGFDPGPEIKNFAMTVVEKLNLSSPSDSAVKMALQQCKGAITASCRIASQAGVFFAETISENPIRAVQEIEKKIRTQLDIWKHKRFDSESGRLYESFQ